MRVHTYMRGTGTQMQTGEAGVSVAEDSCVQQFRR